MITIRDLEEQIRDVEGFRVSISIDPDEEVWSDYDFERRAKDSWTVGRWKKMRFKRDFPHLDLDVIDGSGRVAQGNMTLATVRHTPEHSVSRALSSAGKAFKWIRKNPEAIGDTIDLVRKGWRKIRRKR